MDVSALVFAAAAGASVGSFLNVCADRLPYGRSILWARSECEACSTELRPLDLVPVFSFIWLRGRCRHCGAAIPPRLPVVEAVTAVVYAIILYQAPTVFLAAVYAVHASLLILVALIDLNHQLILNVITYPWAVLALALSTFVPGVGLWGAGAGGIVAFALFVAIFLLSSRGMGFGDVKLAGVIGLIVGLPLVLVAFGVGLVSGGIVAGALLLSGRRRRKDPLPFGVFLSWGGIVALLWGPTIWEAYLRWML